MCIRDSFYTVVGTLMNLACTLPAAYALSRRDMFGNGFFTALFAVTMFFSGGLIPTYLVYKQLGIVNTVWVMLLPGLVTMWNTVVCRTYFSTSIPWELQEASKIDGCGDIRLFASIILPLAAPIIAVMAMFYACLLYTSNPALNFAHLWMILAYIPDSVK